MKIEPTINGQTTARQKIPALDTMRAIAILWVILYHMTAAGFFPSLTNSLVVKVLVAGDAGVDMFFVLSGYLIGTIVFEEMVKTGCVGVRQFWYRRWMRTLPAYYVTLFLIFVGDLFYSAKGSWSPVWTYFVFLQTTVNGYEGMRFGWSWSLCVEELFYFLFPMLTHLLAKAMKLRPASIFRTISLLAVSLSVFGRALLAFGGHGGGHTPGYGVPYCRLDGIAVGLFVATLPLLQNAARSMLLAVLSLAFLGIYLWADPPMWFTTHRFLPLSIIFGTLLYALISNPFLRNMKIPGAVSIAALSYSLYLIHPMTVILVSRASPLASVCGNVLIFSSVTVTVSIMLRFGVELPLLRLRDRRWGG